MANAWPNPVLEELRDEELLLHSEYVEAGGLLDKFASWGWSHPGLTKAVAFLKRVQQIRRAQRHKQQGQQEQQPERHQQAQQPELPELDFMMELTEIAHEHDRPQFGPVSAPSWSSFGSFCGRRRRPQGVEGDLDIPQSFARASSSRHPDTEPLPRMGGTTAHFPSAAAPAKCRGCRQCECEVCIPQAHQKFNR